MRFLKCRSNTGSTSAGSVDKLSAPKSRDVCTITLTPPSLAVGKVEITHHYNHTKYLLNCSMFNVYMDGVVREVNVRMLGKGLELLSANGGWFEINQLLFADDTALVADSEEKL